MKIDKPQQKMSALNIIIFILIWVVFLVGAFVFFFPGYFK